MFRFVMVPVWVLFSDLPSVGLTIIGARSTSPAGAGIWWLPEATSSPACSLRMPLQYDQFLKGGRYIFRYSRSIFDSL